MKQDIENHIALLEDTLKWARDYGKDSFPTEMVRESRRKLRRIKEALNGNCSSAAYGESQVGKSYLMSSLLSTPESPYVVRNKGIDYSFIDEINPSGGNNAKIESTGVVTRFTVSQDNAEMSEYVKIKMLSVVDIILLLADTYYNDIKIKPESVLRYDQINSALEASSRLWQDRSLQYDIIDEDDIKDIGDYVKDVLGNAATPVYQSSFIKTVAPNIKYVAPKHWVEVFQILWNRNPAINTLFTNLIDAYSKLEFKSEIYVPFETVLNRYGTLLKIDWLDGICGIERKGAPEDRPFSDIYDRDGNILARDFPKSELSALTAEITFILPEALTEERKFLKKLDLLDFPGARTREKFEEDKMDEVLPQMLRRGKVAYLFNKYSRSLKISSVLFCHHQEQKSGPTVGETINSWINDNIGKTPKERGALIADTNGVSPLFFVATKFNIDLEKNKNDEPGDSACLDKHWSRFDTVIPEIIKPNRWMEEWVEPGGRFRTPYFQSIFPLRDFYWSSKAGLFKGYSDKGEKKPEQTRGIYPGFEDYFDRLRDSFCRNNFVKKHFVSPEKSWESFAEVNNDGSRPIIESLDSIAEVLDTARRNRYLRELRELQEDLVKALQVYYEPENPEARNRKVWQIAGDIRRSLVGAIAKNPEIFGHIIDSLMVRSEDMRNIAYDIIVCHTETPVDFSALDIYRQLAGLQPNDDRETSVNKLLNFYMLENEEELEKHFATLGFSLEDLVSTRRKTLSTLGDVVAARSIEFWKNHLNAKVRELSPVLPHADEVVFMLLSLFTRLNVMDILTSKINNYCEIFSESEVPNAVGDFVSLTLNNFISNVGRSYIKDAELPDLKEKAAACRLSIDFSPMSLVAERQPQPLEETLKIFDEIPEKLSNGPVNPAALCKLPFWSNFQRWENLVNIGLVYTSDISRCDPECNKKVSDLITRGQSLYK